MRKSTPLDGTSLRSRGIRVVAVPRRGFVRGIHFNVEVAPTDDLRVRRALIAAVDADELSKRVFGGVYPAARQLLVRGTLYYDRNAEQFYKGGMEEARRLLESAGWRVGPGGIRSKGGDRLRVRIVTFPGLLGQAPVEFVQAKWRELGVDTEVRIVGGAAYTPELTRPGVEVNGGLVASYDVDPVPLLWRFYHSSNYGVSNYSHIRDRELDRLLERAMQATDDRERAMAVRDVQRWIAGRGLVLPLYENAFLLGVGPQVRDVWFDPRGNPLLWTTRLVGP